MDVAVTEWSTCVNARQCGPSWRSVELALASSATRRPASRLVAGYRTVRRASVPADEAAAGVFGIVGELPVIAWQLGVAVSSRGALIDATALPAIVDGWLAWEAAHLTE